MEIKNKPSPERSPIKTGRESENEPQIIAQIKQLHTHSSKSSTSIPKMLKHTGVASVDQFESLMPKGRSPKPKSGSPNVKMVPMSSSHSPVQKRPMSRNNAEGRYQLILQSKSSVVKQDIVSEVWKRPGAYYNEKPFMNTSGLADNSMQNISFAMKMNGTSVKPKRSQLKTGITPEQGSTIKTDASKRVILTTDPLNSQRTSLTHNRKRSIEKLSQQKKKALQRIGSTFWQQPSGVPHPTKVNQPGRQIKPTPVKQRIKVNPSQSSGGLGLTGRQLNTTLMKSVKSAYLNSVEKKKSRGQRQRQRQKSSELISSFQNPYTDEDQLPAGRPMSHIGNQLTPGPFISQELISDEGRNTYTDKFRSHTSFGNRKTSSSKSTRRRPTSTSNYSRNFSHNSRLKSAQQRVMSQKSTGMIIRLHQGDGMCPRIKMKSNINYELLKQKDRKYLKSRARSGQYHSKSGYQALVDQFGDEKDPNIPYSNSNSVDPILAKDWLNIKKPNKLYDNLKEENYIDKRQGRLQQLKKMHGFYGKQKIKQIITFTEKKSTDRIKSDMRKKTRNDKKEELKQGGKFKSWTKPFHKCGWKNFDKSILRQNKRAVAYQSEITKMISNSIDEGDNCAVNHKQIWKTAHEQSKIFNSSIHHTPQSKGSSPEKEQQSNMKQVASQMLGAMVDGPELHTPTKVPISTKNHPGMYSAQNSAVKGGVQYLSNVLRPQTGNQYSSRQLQQQHIKIKQAQAKKEILIKQREKAKEEKVMESFRKPLAAPTKLNNREKLQLDLEFNKKLQYMDEMYEKLGSQVLSNQFKVVSMCQPNFNHFHHYAKISNQPYLQGQLTDIEQTLQESFVWNLHNAKYHPHKKVFSITKAGTHPLSMNDSTSKHSSHLDKMNNFSLKHCVYRLNKLDHYLKQCLNSVEEHDECVIVVELLVIYIQSLKANCLLQSERYTEGMEIMLQIAIMFESVEQVSKEYQRLQMTPILKQAVQDELKLFFNMAVIAYLKLEFNRSLHFCERFITLSGQNSFQMGNMYLTSQLYIIKSFNHLKLDQALLNKQSVDAAIKLLKASNIDLPKTKRTSKYTTKVKKQHTMPILAQLLFYPISIRKVENLQKRIIFENEQWNSSVMGGMSQLTMSKSEDSKTSHVGTVNTLDLEDVDSQGNVIISEQSSIMSDESDKKVCPRRMSLGDVPYFTSTYVHGCGDMEVAVQEEKQVDERLSFTDERVEQVDLSQILNFEILPPLQEEALARINTKVQRKQNLLNNLRLGKLDMDSKLSQSPKASYSDPFGDKSTPNRRRKGKQKSVNKQTKLSQFSSNAQNESKTHARHLSQPQVQPKLISHGSQPLQSQRLDLNPIEIGADQLSDTTFRLNEPKQVAEEEGEGECTVRQTPSDISILSTGGEIQIGQTKTSGQNQDPFGAAFEYHEALQAKFAQLNSQITEKEQQWDQMKDYMEKNAKKELVLRKLKHDERDEMQRQIMEKKEDKKTLSKLRSERVDKPKVSQTLGLDELDIVLEEFQNKHNPDSLNLIDRIVKSLKFFKRFDEYCRKDIIKSSQMVQVPKGQYVFKQGDKGEYMYIILRGSIQVRIKNKDSGICEIPVITLYDGGHFGEVALLSDDKAKEQQKEEEGRRQLKIKQIEKRRKELIDQGLNPDDFIEEEDLRVEEVKQEVKPPTNLRKASCLSIEHSYLFQVPQHISVDAFNKTVGKSLNEKISFLRSLPIFSNVPKGLILPIAGNMQIKEYTLGEYIIKAGEEPTGMMILMEGQCLAISEKKTKKTFKESSTSKLTRDELDDHFYRGTTKEDMNITDTTTLKTRERRMFRYEILHRKENAQGDRTIIYRDYTQYSKIQQKHMIGYRVLMPIDTYISNKQKTQAEMYFLQSKPTEEEKKEYYYKCQLSVIVDSAVAKVILIEKSLMSFLPETIQAQVFESMIYHVEVDRVDLSKPVPVEI